MNVLRGLVSILSLSASYSASSKQDVGIELADRQVRQPRAIFLEDYVPNGNNSRLSSNLAMPVRHGGGPTFPTTRVDSNSIPNSFYFPVHFNPPNVSSSSTPTGGSLLSSSVNTEVWGTDNACVHTKGAKGQNSRFTGSQVADVRFPYRFLNADLYSRMYDGFTSFTYTKTPDIPCHDPNPNARDLTLVPRREEFLSLGALSFQELGRGSSHRFYANGSNLAANSFLLIENDYFQALLGVFPREHDQGFFIALLGRLSNGDQFSVAFNINDPSSLGVLDRGDLRQLKRVSSPSRSIALLDRFANGAQVSVAFNADGPSSLGVLGRENLLGNFPPVLCEQPEDRNSGRLSAPTSLILNTSCEQPSPPYSLCLEHVSVGIDIALTRLSRFLVRIKNDRDKLVLSKSFKHWKEHVEQRKLNSDRAQNSSSFYSPYFPSYVFTDPSSHLLDSDASSSASTYIANHSQYLDTLTSSKHHSEISSLSDPVTQCSDRPQALVFAPRNIEHSIQKHLNLLLADPSSYYTTFKTFVENLDNSYLEKSYLNDFVLMYHQDYQASIKDDLSGDAFNLISSVISMPTREPNDEEGSQSTESTELIGGYLKEIQNNESYSDLFYSTLIYLNKGFNDKKSIKVCFETYGGDEDSCKSLDKLLDEREKERLNKNFSLIES